MPKDRDDQPFSHYNLRHKIISWISRTLFDSLTYTVRRGLLKGMRRKGGLAWIPAIGGDFPRTPEEKFFSTLNVSGKVVFDVGAFEGLLTLFLARSAQHVVCYEPNSRNYARLCENLELNRLQNVTVRKYGLGAAPSISVMTSDPTMAGGATLASSISTTIDRRADSRHEEIQVKTLDQELAETNLPQPDFMKVDVEGYELPVLRGSRQILAMRHPAIYLEMHGETMNEKRANVRAIVEYLNAAGYDDICHVESGRKINGENSELAARGHVLAVQSGTALHSEKDI